MKNKLLDIIDFEKINILLEGYNKSTGFVTAILDLEGNILSKSGWRHICTEFHRVHPKTVQKCLISDTVLANKMNLGEKFHFYKCLNGLVDVAFPIVIKGEHIANLFTGQFFFEKPDETFFKKQAKKYGFDENIYLDAVNNVPVISEEKVKVAMEFLLNMTELIAEMSFQQVEQIELNEALTKSEKHHRLLIDNMLEAVAYHQVLFENGIPTDYIYLEVNEAFKNHTGLENVIGKKVSEVLPGIHTNNPEIIERFGRVANTGQSEQYESYISNTNSWYFTSLYALQNNIVVSVFSNITERKTIEEEKQKLYDRISRIASNVPGAFFEYCLNPDGTSFIPYASEGFSRIYGFSPEKVKKDATLAILHIHPEDKDDFSKSIAESAEKLTIWHKEYRVLLPSGVIIWVEGKSTPQKLEDGSILWQGYIFDITHRKKAEEELKESQFFFEQLFLQSSTSTQLLDKEGWCVRINPKLSELFGVLPEHIEGKKYNILKDAEIIRTGVINHLKKVFENKETVRWEVNFDIQHASESTGVKVSKPEKRWFQNIAYPIFDAQGELIFVIIQHNDVSTSKKAEEDILRLNKDLEKRIEDRTKDLTESQTALLNLVEDLNEKTLELNNNAKLLEIKNKELETFTYSVSHDLKAPLRGIDGYSRLLEDEYADVLKGDGQKFVKTIREGTRQMTNLIEDLLTYSRLERSVLRNSKLNIKELINSILLFLKNDIENQNINVELNIDDFEIISDADGLTIAIRNLIENAIKFSGRVNKPKIKIVLKENVYSWILSIEDNGIGFDMKFHNRIFEIFQRLNLPEEYSGTGIGLAMVNKTMERMGGKVWAISSPGKGATFYLEIQKK